MRTDALAADVVQETWLAVLCGLTWSMYWVSSSRATNYPALAGQPVPLSEANHERYGVSSTPTLVLVDREGIVRLYHPGRMTEEELDPLIRRLVARGRPLRSPERVTGPLA